MKRATKSRPPGGTGHGPRKNPLPPAVPEAETGHNLYVALRDLTNIVKGIDDRTKRLEAAVVPPSTWERVKGAVGM